MNMEMKVILTKEEIGRAIKIYLESKILDKAYVDKIELKDDKTALVTINEE